MLKAFEKRPSEKEIKKSGFPISRLMARGLIVRKRDIKKNYEIPEDAPRWAFKFRSSRKKYGVEEVIEEDVCYELTVKGKRVLRSKLD